MPAPKRWFPEDQLINRVKERDKEAFHLLYLQNRAKLYFFLKRLLGNEDDVHEMFQEVFYHAWVNISNYEGPFFYFWLYRMAIQKCEKFLDLKTKQVLVGRLEVPVDECPEKRSEKKVFFNAVESAIMSLPMNYRAVMILGPVQGLSSEQIAEIIGRSVDCVDFRLARARRYVKLKMVAHSQK